MSTLTIPGEYVGYFRKALVYEARLEAEHFGDSELGREPLLGDMRAWSARIVAALDLLERFPTDQGDEPIELADDDAETIAHTCESMARKIVGPKLAETLGYGPFDANVSGEITDLTAAIDWAVETAWTYHQRKAA